MAAFDALEAHDHDRSIPPGTTLAEPAALLAALEELRGFGALREDWDYYGAPPISKQALAEADLLIREAFAVWSVDSHPQVEPYNLAPLANGGVQVEWKHQGSVIEVEIGPSTDLSYLLVQGDREHRSYESQKSVQRAIMLRALGRVLAP